MTRIAFWLTLFCFTVLVVAKFDPQAGFARLIRFGETFQSRQLPSLQALSVPVVAHSSGYDGQFYAQVALDPLLGNPNLATALDSPAYRARRILVPATAALLGFGQPWWIIQLYALLNVGAWFAFAWLLKKELPIVDWISFARWFGCVFSMGVLESVRQSLVDLPAVLLLVMAVRSNGRSSAKPTTLWLALGNLTKESSLLAATALAAYRPHFLRRGLRYIVVAALPAVVWWIYVSRHFPSTSINSSGFGNFTWPLLGLIDETILSTRAILSGNFDSRYTFALIGIAGMIIQSTILWRNRQPDSPWWRIGAAYSILLLVLGPWVWGGYWAVCRTVLPLTIAFNLLLPANRIFWPVWIGGNLTILHAVWRFL